MRHHQRHCIDGSAHVWPGIAKDGWRERHDHRDECDYCDRQGATEIQLLAHPDDVQIGKALNCRGEDVPLDTVLNDIYEALRGELARQTIVKDEEFEFVRERNVFASETGFDGFYMALLKRK